MDRRQVRSHALAEPRCGHPFTAAFPLARQAMVVAGEQEATYSQAAVSPAELFGLEPGWPYFQSTTT